MVNIQLVHCAHLAELDLDGLHTCPSLKLINSQIEIQQTDNALLCLAQTGY